MRHLVDHLRLRVERLRVISGADGASVYLPAPWPGAPEALLVHTGTAGPVAELATMERAQRLQERHNASVGHDAASALLRIVPSETAGGVLLPIPDSSNVAAGAAPPSLSGRRQSDREAVALAGWLGLVFTCEQTAEGLARPNVGDLLGLANSLAHTFVALHALRSDPLTGLPGRAALHGVVSEGLLHASERQRPFSLVLVNPDEFERINEQQGLSAGDQALRETVVVLLGTLRTGDVVIRYGAATFAVVLPGTNASHALAVAEKVRRALASGRYCAGRVHLAFSAGTATWQPGEPSPRNPIELVRRADAALALAKHAGGNCVQAWTSDVDMRSAPRLDRLGGVFTGDQNKDYRNLALLWDALSGAWSGGTPGEIADRFADQLVAALRPDFVGIYEFAEGALRTLHAGRRGTGDPVARESVLGPRDVPLDTLGAACVAGEARHDVSPDGNCLLAVPIRAGTAVIGGVLVMGPATRLRVDASDLTFLEGFAAGIGVAIDRARLAGLERERLDHERRRLAGEVKELRSALHQVKFVYDSPAVESVVFDARRVADTDATVLVTGESGTGKGLLAHTIHLVSRRRHKPFVIVDCGAIPPNLIETELFGHERGAFTGAVTRNPGRIVQADGGTLLLDEVGELPLEVQAKLLRFVEEKQLTSVGSPQVRRVDVRILAATNRDLVREVEAGRFRLDLYHRLSVVPLEVPPLRDRHEDVLLLARHFLASYSAKYQKAVHRLSPDLERRMLGYRWPGNVRELQNRLLRAVLLADDDTLTLAHLPLPADAGIQESAAADSLVVVASATAAAVPAPAAPATPQVLRDVIAAAVMAAADAAPHLRPPLGRWLDDELVLVAFAECQQVAARAALALGLPETTYARRLQRAQRDAQLGTRPASWQAVRSAVVQLVRSAIASPSGTNLLDHAETLLLDLIDRRFPDDARSGAALLGTSIPTYRRRLTSSPLDVAC